MLRPGFDRILNFFLLSLFMIYWTIASGKSNTNAITDMFDPARLYSALTGLNLKYVTFSKTYIF